LNFNITASTAAAGLIQDCEDTLGMEANTIAGSSTLMKVFTKNINEWYKRVNVLIWKSIGTWEYDDSNFSDLPIATTTLVASQQDYEIPSVAQRIDRVEVLNDDGDYQLLKPFDKSEIGLAMSEYRETAGMPRYYDLVGRSVFLYPKPAAGDITTTAGLKIYFSRTVDQFLYTDTTASPGFNVDYHRILSLGAAKDYAISYELNILPYLKGQIDEMEKELKHFYAHRHRGMLPKFRPKRRNYT